MLVRSLIKFGFGILIFALLYSFELKAQDDPMANFKTMNNSTLLSQNLPTHLLLGQNYSLLITIQNLGVTTWSSSNDDYKLALIDMTDNAYQSNVWGVSSVNLPYDVAPTEKVTFTFDIKAPLTAGRYSCQWSMAKGSQSFGEATPVSIVEVSGNNSTTDTRNNALYLTQSIPTAMISGQKYVVTVTLQNNGKSAWSPSTSNISGDYKLTPYYATESKMLPDWGIGPLVLSQPVEPGQSKVFQFEVTAPPPGTYNLQWSIMQGSNYFGDPSGTALVTVVGNNNNLTKSNNNSTFTNQSVPIIMETNQNYPVSVSFTNSGNSTWTKDRYRLVFVDSKMLPISINPWSTGYVDLPETIPPGGTAVFSFNVKAPSSPNSYSFQVSMMESNNPFGTSSPALQIYVK